MPGTSFSRIAFVFPCLYDFIDAECKCIRLIGWHRV